MFKIKNYKQVKTTILAIFGGVLMVAGVLWPEKITIEDSQALAVGVDSLLTGIGEIIVVLTLIFGAKDG